MTTSETIGERLLRLRVAKGLSQREVALKCHRVSYAYISRVEHNERRPTVRAIRQMAAVLGVTAHELEFGEPEFITEEAVRGTLWHRILDDGKYLEQRLGREPSYEEVMTAAAEVSERATEQVAMLLDTFEEDVWTALEHAK